MAIMAIIAAVGAVMCFVGFLLYALCSASGRADDGQDRWVAEHPEGSGEQ